MVLTGEGPGLAGRAESKGDPGAGLSLEVRADPRPGRIVLGLVNGGQGDLLVRMGLLGNGKRQFPGALAIECRDAGGRRFVLSPEPPFVAGRVDPMLLPLPAGASWTLPLDIGKLPVREPRDVPSLPPGRYEAQAVLEGKRVSREETNADTPGLSTMACWTGTVRSAALAVEVPAAGENGAGRR